MAKDSVDSATFEAKSSNARGSGRVSSGRGSPLGVSSCPKHRITTLDEDQEPATGTAQGRGALPREGGSFFTLLPHPWGALRAAPGVGLRRLRPGQRARGVRGRTTRGTTRCPLPVARSRAPRRQVQSAALWSDLPGLGGQRRWKWATWGRRRGAAAASSRPPGGEGSPPGPGGQPCMSKRVSLWSGGRSQGSFDHAA